MEKLLSSELGGKLGRLLLKLESADRASNEMRRLKYFLDDLERFRPASAEQAATPNLYGSALVAIIDQSIIVYCSAFNSSDRRRDGIGRFEAADVFGDDASKLEWHGFLKSHRDKNIAHMTDLNHKVWYLTSKSDRLLSYTGVADVLQNHLQPGLGLWDDFRQHLEFTRLWFDRRALELRSQAERILQKLPDCWFDDLPRPTDNPHIAKSWEALGETMQQILAKEACK